MKKALVCGAGGFIGGHLVKRLKDEGYWVKGVDLKHSEYGNSFADEFIVTDLREQINCRNVIDQYFDEVYQLAADMGGAGYIFTGKNDADVMHNSAIINLNIINSCQKKGIKRIFYSSSACIYPEFNQLDPNKPITREDSAYPAYPDSEYGWEKLFSERLYFSYNRNYGMECRVARYHNIYGPYGTWTGGKEKAPAAICRKVIEAEEGSSIKIWGDGLQTRSFLYIDDCIDATLKLTRSNNLTGPYNIGSEEMISINNLATLVMKIAKKDLKIENISGPEGVRGRSSHNELIRKDLKWEPKYNLFDGLSKTFPWIESQIESQKTTLVSNI